MSDDEAGVVGPDGDDISLPKATVHKLVQGHVGEGLICPKDTKDLIAECAKEFITLIASEANDLCEKSAKKTLMPEHIVAALKSLGYDSFAGPVEESAKDDTAAKKVEKQRKVTKAEASGKTDAELLAEQEALFAASRAKYAAAES